MHPIIVIKCSKCCIMANVHEMIDSTEKPHSSKYCDKSFNSMEKENIFHMVDTDSVLKARR